MQALLLSEMLLKGFCDIMCCIVVHLIWFPEQDRDHIYLSSLHMDYQVKLQCSTVASYTGYSMM